jgi:multidrug resistance efflux pump
MTTENQHRRKTDDSWGTLFKEKVIAPLMVLFIASSSAGGIALYKKLDDLSVQMQQQYTQQQGKDLEFRTSQLERELNIVQSNMVSLEMLKRLEQAMSLLAANGQNDKSMAVIASTIRSELDTRKYTQDQNKGNK